jgi:hypothetical protein
MSMNPLYRWFLPVSLVALFACKGPDLPPGSELNALDREPLIFPDYAGVTIPFNIAPLNFKVREDGSRFRAVFEGDEGPVLSIRDRQGTITIPPGRWSRMLMANRGSDISIRVYKKDRSGWLAYAPFRIRVAGEPIDPYLVYRLIPPGYETWSSMGLYQRDLTSFRERPVIENKYIEDNCVNCHSFGLGGSENMLFHIRGSVGGTMIKRGNQMEKVDLKRDETLSAGVYPAWHPTGAYIAFSTNRIEQYFHAVPEKSIEVLDRQSDLILYEIDTKKVLPVPGTRGDRYMETYPAWSPDGRFLYFSRTAANADTPYDSIRYDIYRMAFDPASKEFGEAEPVYLASGQDQSASFPRISPDGRYLLCTRHNYGTFPIWHKEADLCLMDLGSGREEPQALVNSEDTDSYHSWGSDSRWIVFSSRRQDGRYTKLYISYLNQESQFQKAFLIPQKDPGFYDSFFYSYNRPELIPNPVRVRPRQLIRKARETEDPV